MFKKGDRYQSESGIVVKVIRNGSPYRGWLVQAEQSGMKFHIFPDDIKQYGLKLIKESSNDNK